MTMNRTRGSGRKLQSLSQGRGMHYQTTDEELARILQEEENQLLEDEDHFLAEQDQQSGEGELSEGKRPEGPHNCRTISKEASTTHTSQSHESGDSATLQEQADLELALELAQADMDKTGRDYLREVNKYSGRGRHKQGRKYGAYSSGKQKPNCSPSVGLGKAPEYNQHDQAKETSSRGALYPATENRCHRETDFPDCLGGHVSVAEGMNGQRQRQQRGLRQPHRAANTWQSSHVSQRGQNPDNGARNTGGASGSFSPTHDLGASGGTSSDLDIPMDMLMLFHPFMTDEEWDLNMNNTNQDNFRQHFDGPGAFHSLLATNNGREFSENDYEALLDLAEQLGEVKEKGLKQHKINRLPMRTFTKSNDQCSDMTPKSKAQDQNCSDVADCKVCLSTFQHGDSLRHLPCGHEYHNDCIDEWLKRNAVCPVCRREIK